MNPFLLKQVGFLTPAIQIFLIAMLFVFTTIAQYRYFKKTGKMYERYPLSVSILFAPIYEEIIFRGFILFGLMGIYSTVTAVVATSLLFGLWHLKNIFFMPRASLVYQIFYAGFIFGPIMAIVTICSGTIWLAVILHYLNNLLAIYSKKLLWQRTNK